MIACDEQGGFYDHVAPPRAENPWPHDEVDGFHYDKMGVRVPTILVSPWIKKHTGFRSKTNAAYDSTSILATPFHWYAIPKPLCPLPPRPHHPPTIQRAF